MFVVVYYGFGFGQNSLVVYGSTTFTTYAAARDWIDQQQNPGSYSISGVSTPPTQSAPGTPTTAAVGVVVVVKGVINVSGINKFFVYNGSWPTKEDANSYIAGLLINGGYGVATVTLAPGLSS